MKTVPTSGNRCFAGLAALLSSAAVVTGPTSAAAATQLGETFQPSRDCVGSQTFIPSPAGPGVAYVAPAPGVLTEWRYQSYGAPPGSIRLKIARPAGGNVFTIIAESLPKVPTANALHSFTDIRAPVAAGDVIGLHIAHGGASGGFCARTAPGFATHRLAGDIPPGTTADFGAPQANVQLDVSATLEPDCDEDGLGDETQDPELPLSDACGKGNRALTLDANKNKVKKRKRVRLSGQLSAAARQGPCESAQTVELQRKRPKQASFATFAQVQTDAQGSFSLKKKVKKTFEFRAQVVETAACTAALSNGEKVKVKKPK